jgi:hypothetical protein
VSTNRDPVCDQWQTAARGYRDRLDTWSRTAPDIPAAQWNTSQRQSATAAAEVMREEAASLRRLANDATSPFLRVMLRAQAVYEDALANQLPTYQPPRDARLWQAVQTFSRGVDAVCTAVMPG